LSISVILCLSELPRERGGEGGEEEEEEEEKDYDYNEEEELLLKL